MAEKAAGFDWGPFARQFSSKQRRLLLASDLKRRRECRRLEGDFYAFFKAAWPVLEPTTALIENWHLKTVCGYLQALYEGKLSSPHLIINIPPGSSKSLIASVCFPAWLWTRNAGLRTLSTSNQEDLVMRDSANMRLLVQNTWYQGLWGKAFGLFGSQNAKGYFFNDKRGFRHAVPIRANVTGKRGDVLIIDDPHDARRAFSDVEIAEVHRAYDQGLSTRLNDIESSMVILIMQRLRTNDLAGHLLGKRHQRWHHLRIPMEYEGQPSFDPVRDIGPEAAHLADPRTKVGELLDPVRFPKSAVARLKEDLGDYGYAGQLQQRPSPLAGGILRAKWWRVWGRDGATVGKPLPTLEHVFCSWDTAFSEKELANNAYSAMTRWGVFFDTSRNRHALIMLGRWYERCDYPRLLEKAREETDERLTHEGDAHLIEKKASGISLIQHMRKDRRLPIRGYDPKPDGDKVARAYLAQRLLKAGLVWVPGKPGGDVTVPMTWARDVIDKVGSFPAGEPPSADLTDTVTQALIYLERRHWVHHPDDDIEDRDAPRRISGDPMLEFEDEDADIDTSTRGEERYGYG